MNNILVQIIRDKVQEVQARKEQTPIEYLRDKASVLPKCRNFYKAVTKPNPRGINVIAEVKKASPSAGLIREDFNAVAIAQTYEQCGADAISVLTDEKYFQGKLEYLTVVKEMVSVPVLRKDFIIDPYQVYEARAAGADAVLLIAEALPSGLLMDLVIAANELTLTVLLEVHDADYLLKVRSMLDFPQKHYTVMGINNRNLNTMKVDINTTSRLSDLVENKRELVAESGIKTRQDVEKLIGLGVGAVLIGETLCASPDIKSKFLELFEP